jgi:hypothetical protein
MEEKQNFGEISTGIVEEAKKGAGAAPLKKPEYSCFS